MFGSIPAIGIRRIHQQNLSIVHISLPLTDQYILQMEQINMFSQVASCFCDYGIVSDPLIIPQELAIEDLQAPIGVEALYQLFIIDFK